MSWDPLILELAAHPALLEWMRELCGEHVRLDHGYFYHMRFHEPEHLLMHGNGHSVEHSQYFFFKNGRMHNGLCVAAVALSDAKAGDGGFCCVPGSHKSNYPPPFDPNDQGDPVVHVPVRAGSVVIFTEALRHGTMLWESKTDRRGLFYKYTPSAVAYGSSYATQWAELLGHLPAEWPEEKRLFFRELLAGPEDPYEKGQRIKALRERKA